MENLKKYLIVLAVILALAGIAFLVEKTQTKKEGIKVYTSKQEYKKEELLKIAIQNKSAEKIGFSSCYPYLLEKKNGDWKSYGYSQCPKKDAVGFLVPPGQTKAFEILLNFVDPGPHRLAIPACLNCALTDSFRESERFYSNEFIIK